MSDLRNQAAYSYPSPATNTLPKADISLREILDMYRDNHDLLKQILTAKSEEDKRRTEEGKYKTEQVRLQYKQVELEILREQKKPPTIYTGVPPVNTSTPGFNVKSPSDVHSPYLSIPPPIDAHFPATTPTSATPRLSPPSSATTGHDSVSYNGVSNPHNHSYSPMNQRPSLTLSIPSFPIITASPTAMHNNHSFSTPTSSIPEHPQSATSQTHHHYSQSPTSVNSNNKRTKLSESEVDHEYVMEALRQKVQRNQENPAKKFMNVLKPRSASMPVPPLNQSSPTHHQHHHNNRDQHKQQSPHQRQSQQPPAPSPVDSPMVHSPIPPQLPPLNVHSPSMSQEQVAKT
ncbi:hypothetical protein RhiirA5_360629 [Rhizophagus irregularis]|uniref:Uncharacterized protein n=4 Tax=Rhizophagus irregularis TaxID=588596 RepID=A0A2I1F8Y8_9GLOM|nr:hypothetical protein GLOIN_2v1704933 [Rhizophagus irregularis DAOM 181602=DAOM 197198]EXX55334.1 hypothetical protein RirG_226300 [Rhizophagus irregularis DAOM 197198w]PKC06086.1 hypothetical protein RhiirA5_360629 [Rhizophagus irregularis]PKY30842.1 hypothetical protein RhiirB3_448140 [Rhizophagus irregularis]POG61315.1 hypothetical protein GLOIN_2v1704933 [Rhizophagus irregularis DAOM 181602=DAOM 197198]UZN98744.1 hypothetical protein OCT59_000032 [Rhizophagus irregularis]|eukprot:XP_025168181.1 hypothetical protein GLOIN_2v1704933 [Rhizophagus irregularis DAOM 181602=DAOM 197198]